MGCLNGLKEPGPEPGNKTRLVHLCHVSLRREAEQAKLLQRKFHAGERGEEPERHVLVIVRLAVLRS